MFEHFRLLASVIVLEDCGTFRKWRVIRASGSTWVGLEVLYSSSLPFPPRCEKVGSPNSTSLPPWRHRSPWLSLQDGMCSLKPVSQSKPSLLPPFLPTSSSSFLSSPSLPPPPPSLPPSLKSLFVGCLLTVMIEATHIVPHAAQATSVMIFLPPPPKCWGHSHR